MLWDIHIHNPRTGKTSTKQLDVPGTRSMADVRQVYAVAGRTFRTSEKYMMAVPHVAPGARSPNPFGRMMPSVPPWPPDVARSEQAITRRLFSEGHSYSHRGVDTDNCGFCALTHGGSDGPNYAGWARIYVSARRPIPSRWRRAFDRELASDNKSYATALRRDIATFGPPRFV